MAEDTSTASAPAGEPAAAEQRAPNAETRPAAAAERAPETNQEKETEKANEPEKEKPSGRCSLVAQKFRSWHFFLLPFCLYVTSLTLLFH